MENRQRPRRTAPQLLLEHETKHFEPFQSILKPISCPGGLPLVLFGAYLWTSCAGDLLPAEDGQATAETDLKIDSKTEHIEVSYRIYMGSLC